MGVRSPRILITGATGQVGRRVVEILKNDSSLEVIAAVRNKAKGEKLAVPFVELDLDRIGTFAPALQGIDRLFLMTGYTVDMMQQSKVLLDEAANLAIGAA
jgi:uncharacterized protein YbjT (DUF2867 family)